MLVVRYIDNSAFLVQHIGIGNVMGETNHRRPRDLGLSVRVPIRYFLLEPLVMQSRWK